MNRTRRDFLIQSGALMALTACGGSRYLAGSGGNPGGRPNLVLIFADEMDTSFVGAYGGKFPTPNLDRMAKQGARFDEAYCVSPVCAPSRYSVLTGQYPGRCDNPDFTEKYPKDEKYVIGWNTTMWKQSPSLARMLSSAGYFTGFAGKWGVGFDRELRENYSNQPIDKNADLDDPAVDRKLREHQAQTVENVKQTAGFDFAASVFPGNVSGRMPERLHHHNIEWITKGALEFLDEAAKRDQPFFLYLTPTTVHGPDHSKDLDADPLYTVGGKLDKPVAAHPSRKSIRERLEKAGVEIESESVGMTFFDDQVGAILDKIEAMGAADNTLVVFMPDHGVEPGKATCFQQGVQIPMLAQWPAKIPAGSVVSQRVQNVDVMPTFLAAAKTSLPEGPTFDGIDMTPSMVAGEKIKREPLYFEFGVTRAVLKNNFKYVAFRYTDEAIAKMEKGEVDVALDYLQTTRQLHSDIAIRYFPAYFEPDQLYDLSMDPNEQRNLAQDPRHAAIFQDMQRELEKKIKSIGHPFSLEVPRFMRSAKFRELAKKRQAASANRKWWHEDFSWPEPPKEYPKITDPQLRP
ncbi:MAG: sulfatase [Candidatus Sumerlaeia bacterium]